MYNIILYKLTYDVNIIYNTILFLNGQLLLLIFYVDFYMRN